MKARPLTVTHSWMRRPPTGTKLATLGELTTGDAHELNKLGVGVGAANPLTGQRNGVAGRTLQR
jgi:hypothetical protein